MSTVVTSSLSDTLPSTVPKLDAEGDNWAIFYVHFMDAVEVKGFWGHFDGSLSPPVTTATFSDTNKTTLVQWEKDERSVKTLLTQQLLDSLVMEIHSKKSVKERWEAIPGNSESIFSLMSSTPSFLLVRIVCSAK